MPQQDLRLVFTFGTLDVENVWQAIQKVLNRHEDLLTDFEIDEKRVKFADVGAQLRKPGKKHFFLTGSGFEFDLGSVTSSKLEFLRIRSLNDPKILWDEWADEFIRNSNFVMAWLADVEYEYWQNAEDPLLYSSVGRPYHHLPMKSNGLPYPLEQKIIDISGNPGRWFLQTGYYEAVGALMWLGKPFWQLTGAYPEEVLNADWLQVSQPSPSVIRIKSAEEPFTSADEPNGTIQQRLRFLLYPKSE
jgi:hypothetical protein